MEELPCSVYTLVIMPNGQADIVDLNSGDNTHTKENFAAVFEGGKYRHEWTGAKGEIPSVGEDFTRGSLVTVLRYLPETNEVVALRSRPYGRFVTVTLPISRFPDLERELTEYLQ